MDFDTWDLTAQSPFGADPIWRMKALRMAIYLLDLTWEDARQLCRWRLTDPVAMQLYRAVGSIGSNLMEGYSRSSGVDRVRFYEYSLGSTRESQLWYYAGRHILKEAVVRARMDLLTRIKQLVHTAIPRERQRVIRPG